LAAEFQLFLIAALATVFYPKHKKLVIGATSALIVFITIFRGDAYKYDDYISSKNM
jgi:hypothetical protein